MKKMIGIAVAIVILIGTPAAADPMLQVFTSLAPAQLAGPSGGTWTLNVNYAIRTGQTAAGTPGTPGYAELADNMTIASSDAIVTNFFSWRGELDPGNTVGSNYAFETGNRMHFPVWIFQDDPSDLVPFSLSELSFTSFSTDPAGALGFSVGLGGYQYSLGYIGLNYGADGIRGTSDDEWITTGSNTQLVHELFGRGSGNAFVANCGGCDLGGQKMALSSTASYPGFPFEFTGVYQLIQSGELIAEEGATFQIVPKIVNIPPEPEPTPVPEPTTLVMLGSGLLAVSIRARKR